MRFSNFLDYYSFRPCMKDKQFKNDLIEMVVEEVKRARETAIIEGRIQRENEIKHKLLSALLGEE